LIFTALSLFEDAKPFCLILIKSHTAVNVKRKVGKAKSCDYDFPFLLKNRYNTLMSEARSE